MPRYIRRRSRYVGSVKNYQPKQTVREAVKNALIRSLYFDQLQHWNLRLQKLAKINATTNGYVGSFPAGKLGGISYQGRTWTQVSLGWLDENMETAYCFPLDTSDPEVVDEMHRITAELDEIAKEKYESERLLSGLLTQNFDLDDLREVLGESLYGVFQAELKNVCIRKRTDDQRNQDRARLLAFASQHESILDRMNERSLINLISMDVFGDPQDTSLD